MNSNEIINVITFLVPVISLLLQIYSEFKASKDRQKITNILYQNDIHFNNNDGIITLNQNVNNSIEQQIDKYNNQIKNTIFYSSILSKINGFVIITLIIVNITIAISNNWHSIINTNFFSHATDNTFLMVLLETVLKTIPHIFKQVYFILTIYCLGNALNLILKKSRDYQIPATHIAYYFTLTILYYLTTYIHFDKLLPLDKIYFFQSIPPLLKDAIPYVSMLILIITAEYYIAPTLIDRLFNLIKQDHQKGSVENKWINFKDNFGVLIIPFILLIINYFLRIYFK